LPQPGPPASSARSAGPRLPPRPQGEDGAADVPDRGVEVVDSRLDALRDLRDVADPTGTLQAQANDEEPLGDQVVQVAADAVTILEHGQALLGRPRAQGLQSESGLFGEAGSNRASTLAGDLDDLREHPVQTEVGRHGDNRALRPIGHTAPPKRPCRTTRAGIGVTPLINSTARHPRDRSVPTGSQSCGCLREKMAAWVRLSRPSLANNDET
jgi:hypothetical protein